MSDWQVESEGDTFERFVRKLPAYEQAVALAAIEHILAKDGIDICQGEWGKALGRGLYEFRIRHSLRAILGRAGVSSADVGTDRTVLLRVFCTFYGKHVVLLLHGYDKGRDPSTKRQIREISKARLVLAGWIRRARTS